MRRWRIFFCPLFSGNSDAGIVTILFYFFAHGFGHQIANRVSVANLIAHRSCRYVENGRVKNCDASTRMFYHRIAAALIHIQLELRHNQSGIFPSRKILQTVATHDDVKRMLRVFFCQIRKRINSIRRAGQRKFRIGCAQAGVVTNRQPYQMQSVVFVQ